MTQRIGHIAWVAAMLVALGIALSGCATPGTGTSDAGAQENRLPAENQSDDRNNLADGDDALSNDDGNRDENEDGDRDDYGNDAAESRGDDGADDLDDRAEDDSDDNGRGDDNSNDGDDNGGRDDSDNGERDNDDDGSYEDNSGNFGDGGDDD